MTEIKSVADLLAAQAVLFKRMEKVDLLPPGFASAHIEGRGIDIDALALASVKGQHATRILERARMLNDAVNAILKYKAALIGIAEFRKFKNAKRI